MPYVTGTSVLGVTFKDGVIIASDMLGMSHPQLRLQGSLHLLCLDFATAVSVWVV